MAATGTKNAKPLSFEKGLKQLEELVKKMESGEIELEKALEMYEEGVKLSRELERILTKAEKKIEILSREGKIESLEEEQPKDNDKLPF